MHTDENTMYSTSYNMRCWIRCKFVIKQPVQKIGALFEAVSKWLTVEFEIEWTKRVWIEPNSQIFQHRDGELYFKKNNWIKLKPCVCWCQVEFCWVWIWRECIWTHNPHLPPLPLNISENYLQNTVITVMDTGKRHEIRSIMSTCTQFNINFTTAFFSDNG